MGRRPVIGTAGLAPALAAFVLLAWRFRFVCDDAFISFRYARNWAAGHGLRYNLGDGAPVEGYSNFLWTALAALCEWAGLQPARWLPWVSFLCGCLLLVRLHSFLVRRMKLAPAAAALGTLFTATLPPFAVWATGGLETMTQALLVFLVFEKLTDSDRGSRGGWWAGLFASALVLIRVEGFAWVLVLGLAGWLAARMTGRPFTRVLRPFAALSLTCLAAHLLWRNAYYGALISNTAEAKFTVAWPLIHRGLSYSLLFLATYVTPLALILAPLAWVRRDAQATAASIVVAAGFGSVIAAGGDFMSHFRLFVPVLALLPLVIVPPIAGGVNTRGAGAVAAGVGVAVILIGVLPAADIHLIPTSLRKTWNVRRSGMPFRSETKHWESMVHNSADWRAQGMALGEWAPAGSSVVESAIGNVGYFSEMTIFDQHGLVTREVARLPVTRLRGPGHDKWVEPTFFLDREPTVLYNRVVRNRAQAAGALRSWKVAELTGYVPEFIDVTSVPDGKLLVLRRLRRGEESAAQRTSFLQQLATLPARAAP